MPVSWVEHGGQRILYVDYRNLGPSECIDTLREQTAAIAAAADPVLTLVDARGVVFTSEFMAAAKADGPRNTKRTRRRAIVGTDGGFRKVLLILFNIVATPVPMQPFATVEEALAYLTGP